MCNMNKNVTIQKITKAILEKNIKIFNHFFFTNCFTSFATMSLYEEPLVVQNEITKRIYIIQWKPCCHMQLHSTQFLKQLEFFSNQHVHLNLMSTQLSFVKCVRKWLH